MLPHAEHRIDELLSRNKELEDELQKLRLFYSELESTNNHLVSATWRERDMKKKLTETLDELSRTKQIIDVQNRRISESINYARKIQIAINPTEPDLAKHFADSFIYYLPKDVISGDFPWLVSREDYVYIAAVDCTGHGVPGAMMSMIGNLLLNDIINGSEILLPSQVLKKLHFAVVGTLKQESPGSNSNDGMDIALARINVHTGELVFSGAHRPLFIYSNGEQESIPGDRFPIGGVQYKGKNEYTDHVRKLYKGDRVFLFTDGLSDQIGGSEKRKMMLKGVREFYDANSACSMVQLKERTSNFFRVWKGDQKQIDDILVIGVQY